MLWTDMQLTRNNTNIVQQKLEHIIDYKHIAYLEKQLIFCFSTWVNLLFIHTFNPHTINSIMLTRTRRCVNIIYRTN